jgi:hypothetical protein
MGWNLRIAVLTVLGGAMVVGVLLVVLHASATSARSGSDPVSAYTLNTVTTGGMPASVADGDLDSINQPRWQMPDRNANDVMGMLANSRNDNGIEGSIVMLGTPDACPDGNEYLGTITMVSATEQITGGLVFTPGTIAVDITTASDGQVAMGFYSCPI